ncbi:hypothetical protein [Nannocystis punicea]|uniref:FeoB-associated Cys-rich membrane protein n=1 Tax=Nannocystis punicea TaxID=2995304 RepID=A0ABY7H489_9BACT|nr:hypothetical protein [Nannocystis poenicansa]WAS94091.1 hypothetical protein O0S08_48830 [Nannocystis poenicansa]
MPEADLQVLLQQLAALAAVALAAGWLTARWLIRRRADCGGSCARCEGAAACEKASTGAVSPGASSSSPRGVRSPALRVMQSGPGSAAHPGNLPGPPAV